MAEQVRSSAPSGLGDVEVREGYAEARDGAPLYFQVVGRGRPAIACCNGIGVSTFFFRHLVERFHRDHAIVLWDYPGHGRSGLPPEPDTCEVGVERCAADLRTVLAAAGVDAPVVLVGHSMGCQVILEYALRHPGEVRALIPLFGTAGRPLDTFLHLPQSRHAVHALRRMLEITGRRGRRLTLPFRAQRLALGFSRLTGLVDRHFDAPDDIARYLEHLTRLDARFFLRMLDEVAEHDLDDRLPEITAPTLVIAAENDRFTPLERSRRMAERIPHAELLVLAEGSHAAIVEHPETINRRIARFLAERVER